MIKKFPIVILFASLILLSFCYAFPSILQKRPQSIHQWRQCDALSITLNYYQEKNPFFEPQINLLNNNKPFKVVSEFPILYYIISQIWKITGQSELIFRLINISIVFLGLFYLYKLFNEFIRSNFWSIISVLFIFTSPILVFYSNNFIVDAPALGIAFIGSYFLWKYYSTNKLKFLIIACFTFTFCGLLKITSLIVFLAIIPIHIYLIITKRSVYKFFTIIPFAITLLIVIGWFCYAAYYNHKNGSSELFLLGILPLWDRDYKVISYIAIAFYKNILPSFYNKFFLFVLIITNFIIFIKYKKYNLFLFALTLLVSGGIVLYFLLFYQAMDIHDYYLVNLLIIIPLFLISILDFCRTNYSKVFNHIFTKVIAIVCLIVLVYQTSVINRMKYDVNDFFVKSNLFIDKETLDYWKWYHWNYSMTIEPLEEIENYLRALNINKDDAVISIPDNSFNITLYLMNQNGYTDYGYFNLEGEQRIRHFINLGAKYLIVNDCKLLEKEYLKPFFNKKIGNYMNINIYKLE